MGKKPSGGGGGWLATVRMVFKSSKNERHGKKQRGGEAEGAAVGSGEAADIVSVDHFPTAETSPEVTNEGSSGAVVWREKGEHEVAGAARRDRQGIAAAMTAASRVARSGAARGNAGSREERAAVRIQAFYRGYLARRARRALRGLVLLQALVRGHQVRRQVHLTMRCMQALIRAQTRVRARRLTSHRPRRATQLDAQYRRPGLVDLVPSRAQGARLSFGHSIASHSLPGTWDAEPADGMPRRRDALAASWGDSAPTYACGLQHQRQLNELQLDDNDESSGGWRWLEHCHTGGQPKQQASQHGPTETSYVTAAATDGVSENTVEMEEAASRKSPTRDLYPVRPPAIPGYMAATQSALAKTRMAPPPAPRAGTRTRSGSVAHSGGLTSSIANLGWSMSHGAASTHAPQHRAGHSPESSCSGDRTPPVFGDRRKLAFG